MRDGDRASAASKVFEAHRQQGRRSNGDYMSAERDQRMSRGAGDAAIGDVTHDGDPLAREIAQAQAQSEHVENCLGRMFVTPITSVDDRAGDMFGHQGRAASDRCANDDGVDAHRLNVARGVDERLALGSTRTARAEIHHLGAQALGGDLEAHASTGGVFEKKVGNDAPAQPLF